MADGLPSWLEYKDPVDRFVQGEQIGAGMSQQARQNQLAQSDLALRQAEEARRAALFPLQQREAETQLENLAAELTHRHAINQQLVDTKSQEAHGRPGPLVSQPRP